MTALPQGMSLRLAQLEPNPEIVQWARNIARILRGRHPSALYGDEFDDVCSVTGLPPAMLRHVLGLLQAAGYGAVLEHAPAATVRQTRRRLVRTRRRRKLRNFTGLLPRAVALRLPTTAYTHRKGRMDGHDIWGDVRCNLTLRHGHLGTVAAACGRWRSESRPGETFARWELAELAFLLRAADRQNDRIGGDDIAWIVRLLTDLNELECDGAIARDADPSDSHQLPSSPIDHISVETADGQLVPLRRWLALVDAGQERVSARTTVLIYLPQWVRDELAHAKRRPTIVHFGVWRMLHPTARRLYAFLQGKTRNKTTSRLEFYVSDKARFTFGLSSKRRDRTHAIIVHALNEIRQSDQRYAAGWAPGEMPRSGLPTYGVKAGVRVPSGPLRGRRGKKASSRRSVAMRLLAKRPEALGVYAELSSEDAKRAREAVRTMIRESLDQATPPPGRPDRRTRDVDRGP